MAALVCDICGGKLIMGAGGIAVCDSCGMEYSTDRMKEKVQEIKGIVRVDNSHMIKNYLEMAQSAKDVDNNEEAEAYCNKVIEIEPTNYKAWMLKGKAAAWQSSTQNCRVDEGVAAFIKAINYAPDDAKDALIEEAKEQIKNLSIVMITLRANRFAKWPDSEETSEFISDIEFILNTTATFASQTGAIIPVAELMVQIAIEINQSVVKAWQNVIWPEYGGDLNSLSDRPGKCEWQTFIERAGYCIELLEKAIDLCDEDDEEDINCYENLIFIHKAAIDSCSWDYNIFSWGKSWYKGWCLSNEAKDARRELIREYEGKIAEIKKAKVAREAVERAEQERIEKEEAQKRFVAYWAEHAAEKASLEAEAQSLTEQITALEKEIENIPDAIEKTNIQDRINALIAEKSALGLFKGKEKKAIQEKIDAENVELKAVSDKVEFAKQEIEQKIEPLRVRWSEITSELTMAR